MARSAGGLSVPCTSKEELSSLWDLLMEAVDQNFSDEEQVSHFLHCTSLTGKERILDSRKLYGGYTESPARAPLASNKDLKGNWFALALKDGELPRKSPYGTQRIKIPVSYLMEYIGNTSMAEDDDEVDDDMDDAAPAKSSFYEKQRSKRETAKAKKGKRKKTVFREIKSKSQEVPVLFFESAHAYNERSQYVRLVLLRSNDPNVQWCEDNLHKVDLNENPFFQWTDYRLTSSKNDGSSERALRVEVLMVGNIELDKVKVEPEWDEVGKGMRAGGDPRICVL